VVCGTDKIRKAIESGAQINEIRSGWKIGLEAFEQVRRKYLIYQLSEIAQT